MSSSTIQDEILASPIYGLWTGSSGVPGIGYLLGKGVKWLGLYHWCYSDERAHNSASSRRYFGAFYVSALIDPDPITL